MGLEYGVDAVNPQNTRGTFEWSNSPNRLKASIENTIEESLVGRIDLQAHTKNHPLRIKQVHASIENTAFSWAYVNRY